jgi:hypothetical protein
MDGDREHLRRLAVHDDGLWDAITVRGSWFGSASVDVKTAALVRVAATMTTSTPRSTRDGLRGR